MIAIEMTADEAGGVVARLVDKSDVHYQPAVGDEPGALIVPDDMEGAGRAALAAGPLPPLGIVSPRQFRRALLAAGLLDAVEALMADAKTPRALKIDWEFATEIRSDYPAWPDMIKAIGKTQADLDALFAAASQIA